MLMPMTQSRVRSSRPVAGQEELRPPVADAGGAGEGVTDQDGVVARGVELAIDGVVQGGVDEDFAAFEREDFVEDEVSLERRLGYWDASSSVILLRYWSGRVRGQAPGASPVGR